MMKGKRSRVFSRLRQLFVLVLSSTLMVIPSSQAFLPLVNHHLCSFTGARNRILRRLSSGESAATQEGPQETFPVRSSTISFRAPVTTRASSAFTRKRIAIIFPWSRPSSVSKYSVLREARKSTLPVENPFSTPNFWANSVVPVTKI
jgi:hypothetical protein